MGRGVSGATTPAEVLIADLLNRLSAARIQYWFSAQTWMPHAHKHMLSLFPKSSTCLYGRPVRRRAVRSQIVTTHFRGVLTAGIASLFRELDGHDLIFVVGAPVFRYHQFEPGHFLRQGAILLHLTCE